MWLYPEVPKGSQVHFDRELALEVIHKCNTKRTENRGGEGRRQLTVNKSWQTAGGRRGQDQISYCVDRAAQLWVYADDLLPNDIDFELWEYLKLWKNKFVLFQVIKCLLFFPFMYTE